LGGRAPKRWRELWALPQAIMWERMHLELVIARYAVKLVEAEKPDAPVSLVAEVRLMEDRLGLSPVALRRLGWEIETDEPAVKLARSVSRLDDYRSQLD
jgi:hypothetical protein